MQWLLPAAFQFVFFSQLEYVFSVAINSVCRLILLFPHNFAELGGVVPGLGAAGVFVAVFAGRAAHGLAEDLAEIAGGAEAALLAMGAAGTWTCGGKGGAEGRLQTGGRAQQQPAEVFKVSGKLQLSPCCVLDTAVDFDEG